MKSISLIMNPEVEGNTLENHDMHLISPSGSLITPEVAINDPNMDFQEDISYGFALYHLINPEPGEWQIKYNSDIDVKIRVVGLLILIFLIYKSICYL